MARSYSAPRPTDFVDDRAHYVGHYDGYSWAKHLSLAAAFPAEDRVSILVLYALDGKWLHVDASVGKDGIGRDQVQKVNLTRTYANRGYCANGGGYAHIARIATDQRRSNLIS